MLSRYEVNKKPNIITPFNDKQRFKNLVFEVIDDTFITTHSPDSVTLDGFISLTLQTKSLFTKICSSRFIKRLSRCISFRIKTER